LDEQFSAVTVFLWVFLRFPQLPVKIGVKK